MLTLSLGDPFMKQAGSSDKLFYNLYVSARNLYPTDQDALKDFDFKNLDYILGFRINYKSFTVNPEFIYHYSVEIDDLIYDRHIFSFLAGYKFRHFNIKTGPSLGIFYPLAVDFTTLRHAESIVQEKYFLCLEYFF
ncbi:MAG: hypothetical protein FJY07_11495 [Bacteroidetes bacterium]|nr:hypothetical protein [Bacteroidota bacterium]